MLIVPVIDLYHGQAVRAVAGQREQYQALNTPLSPHAAPPGVVEAYRTLYPFKVFYLADLDAILGDGDHRATVLELLQRFPDFTWWLDAGFSRAEDLAYWSRFSRLRAVLGSESQIGLEGFQRLLAQARQPLLSLDYRQNRFLGPQELLTTPAIWPDDIILMQLDRVGVGQGPDSALPAVSNKRFYAAGGVRDGADLQKLAAAGYAGVLVASALHDKRLSAMDIAALMR